MITRTVNHTVLISTSQPYQGYFFSVQPADESLNPQSGYAINSGDFVGSGGPLPLFGDTLPILASATLTLSYQDLPAFLAGSVQVTLWGYDGAWVAVQSEVIDFFPLLPYLEVWPIETPRGFTILFARVDEATTQVVVADNIGTYTGAPNTTDRLDGQPAFAYMLPPQSRNVTITITANHNTASVTLPDRPGFSQTSYEREWALPPWLPVDGRLAQILDAVDAVLPSAVGVEAQLDPRTAEDVESHATVYGVTPFPGEPKNNLRARILALPHGKHTARAALEQHLSTVARAPVTIGDEMSAAMGHWRLDGLRPLNAQWNLGGSDADANNYRIRLWHNSPMQPVELRQEIERLRPHGQPYHLCMSVTIPGTPPLDKRFALRRITSAGQEVAVWE